MRGCHRSGRLNYERLRGVVAISRDRRVDVHGYRCRSIHSSDLPEIQMICIKCRTAADAKPDGLHPLNMVKRLLHEQCKGGTWCDCQHREPTSEAQRGGVRHGKQQG